MRQLSLIIALVLTSLTAPPAAAAQRLKLPDKLDKLEARAQADSNDAAAHYNLALGYWSKERYDDAESAMRLAMKIDPQLAEAYLALAHLLYARRPKVWDEISDRQVPEDWLPALEEADRMYRQAFLINPLVDLKIIGAVTPAKSVYWEAYPALREIYLMFFQGFDDVLQGKYDRAYFRFERLIDDLEFDRDASRTPQWLLWYHALAAARLEKYEDAIGDLEILLGRALDEERSDELVHVPLKTNEYRYVLATLKHRAGFVDEALALYREALENDLGLYMAHVQIARIHESRENWVEAAEECRRAVAANPEDPSLLYDLGVTLGRANRLGEAQEVLERAEQLNPRDARIPYVLGLVRISRGDTDGAREAFEQFVSIAPSRYEGMISDAERRLKALR